MTQKHRMKFAALLVILGILYMASVFYWINAAHARIEALEAKVTVQEEALRTHSDLTIDAGEATGQSLLLLLDRVEELEKADRVQGRLNDSHARLIHRLYRGSF